MQSPCSEWLLQRLEERKYCLQEIILNCLKKDESLKQQLSYSAAQVVEQLQGNAEQPTEQETLSTFCIPSESLVFIPKEPWEDLSSETNSIGRKVKAFQVTQVELSASFLIVAGDSWVSFWLLPSKGELGKLPHCDQVKLLPSHWKVLNLVLSQDERYLLIQACDQVTYTAWKAELLKEEEEEETLTVHNMLFSMKDYTLVNSFSFSFPIQYLSQERRLWSILLSCCRESYLLLYTIANLGSLYFVDVMEEGTFVLRPLSSDGLQFQYIDRIYCREHMNNEYFVCGLSYGGTIEIYQFDKHLLSFNVSAFVDWVIPYRIYVLSMENGNLQKHRDYDGDNIVVGERFALSFVFIEWNIVSSCYIVHFMIQDSQQSNVKVNKISLDFLGEKKLVSWNLSRDETPLLCLSTVDGMIVLIDMEHCRHVGNILLTREEQSSLVQFRSFGSRAVALWRSFPGLVHFWEDVHLCELSK